jgi:hypothetical protein
MTLPLTLGISSCKTANQASKPSTELQLTKRAPNAQAEGPPPIFVSKNIQARPEVRHIFPKVSTLKNLTDNQVHALLGTPSFKRSDDPAEFWQYSNDKCTLDLFLYKNLDTAIRKVVHYETRTQSGHVLTKNECFEIVIKALSKAS